MVVDERSIELTLGGESMVSLVNEHRNLVVVRSLCEPFAMPGIPISYCIAHPDTIAQITRFYDSSCVPMFAEVIGELALTETEHLERTREFLDSEIPWLQCMLNLIPGIDIFPAEANYVMCTFDAGPDLALMMAAPIEAVRRKGHGGDQRRSEVQDTPFAPDKTGGQRNDQAQAVDQDDVTPGGLPGGVGQAVEQSIEIGPIPGWKVQCRTELQQSLVLVCAGWDFRRQQKQTFLLGSIPDAVVVSLR